MTARDVVPTPEVATAPSSAPEALNAITATGVKAAAAAHTSPCGVQVLIFNTAGGI